VRKATGDLKRDIRTLDDRGNIGDRGDGGRIVLLDLRLICGDDCVAALLVFELLRISLLFRLVLLAQETAKDGGALVAARGRARLGLLSLLRFVRRAA
jgi:hypothetical protein